MKAALLTYDGTTYRLSARAVTDLAERGIIVEDPVNRGRYELATGRLIEEVEPLATFGGFVSGDTARGEGEGGRLRRMIAVAFQHRDRQGGR